jgi:hypothetical protein
LCYIFFFSVRSFIYAMIANIEENGPYIVLSKGFAVPHEGIPGHHCDDKRVPANEMCGGHFGM